MRADTTGVRQAESFLRPLLRRRLRMVRPARVDIRLRKPWSRLRFRLLGWKVLFTVLPRSCWSRRPVPPDSVDLEADPERPRDSVWGVLSSRPRRDPPVRADLDVDIRARTAKL